MNEVKDTCLWFFGEKLVRADLFVPVKDLQQATATIDKLKAEFAGQNGPVLLCRYADPLELPKKKGPQKATDTIPFLPKLSEDELTVTFHVPYFQAPSPKKDPVKSRQNRQDQFVQQPANTLAELFQTRCTHITDLFGKYFYYGTGMARANEDIHPHALQYSPETGVLSPIRKTDPGYISVSVIHPAFSFLSGLGTEKEPDTIRFPSGNEPKNAPKSADAAPQWK